MASASSCPLTDAAHPEPDCAHRLVLRECLEQWRTEATHGVCDTGRYRCRHVVWGRGPTLVLIPGMGQDAVGFVMLMARLQTHFHCVSFDLPDADGDGARLMTYRHSDHVADLFALLDHLSIRECILLGSSFGSTIALAPAGLGPAVVSAGDADDDAAPRSATEDGVTRAPGQTPASLGATITPATAAATAMAPAQYNALAEYMTTEPRR